MEKTFKYDPKVGWNWHKSWNLPTISIIISVIDNETIQEILCPSNLYVEIYAVKAVFNNLENFHLHDVGLCGQTKAEITDGVGSFTSLKFSTTSYINEGVKFHLVICLMFKQEDSGNPKILFSRISPPIFIDSRRSARGAHKQRILANSFSDFFESQLLIKKFVKKDAKSKDKVPNNTEEIDNSLKGLFNYLTAPNIRHKIKHPLFLAMKFNLGIKLYLLKEEFNTESEEELLKKVHECVVDSVENKNEVLRAQNTKICLLLNIQSTREHVIHVKKISDIIAP